MKFTDLMFIRLFLIILSGTLACCQGSPNLKLVVSKEGLEVAANRILELLSVEASDLKMEGLGGKAEVGGGTLDYYVENLQVLEFNSPKFNVAIKPGVGLTLYLSEATVRLTTGWGVAFQRGVLRFRNNGTGEVVINGTGIDLETSFEVDKEGRLLLVANSCTPRVGGILYRLDDEALFYDLVIQMLKKKIRTAVEKGICQGAVDGINKDLGQLISKSSFKTNLGNDLEFDLGLTSTPVLTDEYIEVPIASKFLDDSADISIKEFKDAVDMKVKSGHMISLYVSEELFNGAFRILHKKDRLTFAQTSPTILSFLGPLNISTASTVPGAHFSIGILATTPPVVSITTDNITVSADIIGSIVLKLSENFTYDVLRLSLTIQCQLKLSVDDGQLVGTLDDVVALPKDSSSIPGEGKDIIKESMNSTIRTILSTLDISQLRSVFPKVCKNCTSIADTVVSLHEGFLVVAMNLKNV